MHDLAERPIDGPGGPRRTDDLCQQLAGDRYLIDGRELSLPMSIADCALMVQVFAVPTAAAAALMADTGLRVAELWPGRSAVTLMGVRYRDNPLGDYNEAVISLPVYPPGTRALPLLGGLDVLRGTAAHFVHAMPVDQPFTAHAGRFMWGYPKFLAAIDVTFEESEAHARFSADGELVFAMTTPAGGARRAAESASNLTLRGGQLRRVEARFEGEGLRVKLGGARPEIGEHHPLARDLRSLGLPARPLLSASLRSASAVFQAAQVLGTGLGN